MTAPPAKRNPPGVAPGGMQKPKGQATPSLKRYQNTTKFASELQIHAAIREWLDTVLPADFRCFHCPNGEIRDKRTAAKLKWLGVKPGVPNLIIIGKGGRVCFIEIKNQKGRLSPEQREFGLFCATHSIPFSICRSVDDARAALKDWRIPTREAPA